MRTNYTVRCGPTHIAICDISKINGKLYEVHRINVPPAYRGRGFGRELLKQLLADADANSVCLRLWVLPSGGLGRRKLTAWYLRHAFIQREDGFLYREPQCAPTSNVA
jgi:N-acetylglutamate synthase-like GNAT family acetyltransferase